MMERTPAVDLEAARLGALIAGVFDICITTMIAAVDSVGRLAIT